MSKRIKHKIEQIKQKSETNNDFIDVKQKDISIYNFVWTYSTDSKLI